MDAITLLKQDHKTVEKLFKQFEKAEDKPQEARTLADQMIEELSVHAAIEEQIFYPAIRKEMPDAEDDVLEAFEEHHVVKWLLSEIDGMPATHERFRPKVMVLIESVRHHVEEEEQTLFPEVRKVLKRKRLTELGDEMEAAKKSAPRKPNPTAGDVPTDMVTSTGSATVNRSDAKTTAGKG
jgi:hemerythrin-like domain-containing protein